MAMRKRDFDRLMTLLATASPAQLRAAEGRLSELNTAKAALLLAEERMARGGSSCCHSPAGISPRLLKG